MSCERTARKIGLRGRTSPLHQRCAEGPHDVWASGAMRSWLMPTPPAMGDCP
ncbi:Hypothetical protein AA314_02953 [Archangium gephyra]|uniref:Uncharacterized protein n=1 Tax=Archangium gephyra TaxID=48 RepID=A0AAC8Q5Q6_9BACT|nr:Hypothetical protein AA314_02953 [Archangium gephyra]